MIGQFHPIRNQIKMTTTAPTSPSYEPVSPSHEPTSSSLVTKSQQPGPPQVKAIPMLSEEEIQLREENRAHLKRKRQEQEEARKKKIGEEIKVSKCICCADNDEKDVQATRKDNGMFLCDKCDEFDSCNNCERDYCKDKEGNVHHKCKCGACNDGPGVPWYSDGEPGDSESEPDEDESEEEEEEPTIVYKILTNYKNGASSCLGEYTNQTDAFNALFKRRGERKNVHHPLSNTIEMYIVKVEVNEHGDIIKRLRL